MKSTDVSQSQKIKASVLTNVEMFQVGPVIIASGLYAKFRVFQPGIVGAGSK